MTVKFLLGRRGTGKTHHIIEAIKEKLKQSPLGDPIIMISPRQSTFSIEQSLSQDEQIKGSMRTAIYSFDRLYWRLKAEMGGTDRTPISKAGLEMLTYEAINNLQDELLRFKTASKYYGFSQKLSQTISELKRYNVSASDLMDINQQALEVRTRDKLHDIALVYQYLDGQMNNNFMQNEDTLYHLIEMIQSSRSIKRSDIYIDGFYNFTTIEYLVILALCKHARSVTIALTMDPGNQSGLFRKTEETFQHLTDYFHAYEIKYDQQIFKQQHRFKQQLLSHLESNFDALEVSAYHDNSIQLTEASSMQQEVNNIIHKVYNLCKNEYRYKDIAILYRDSSYAELLIERANQIGVPYHTDMKDAMHHHHSIESIRSLLDFFKNTYNIEALFRALKTGLITKSHEKHDLSFVDMLENVMISRGMNYKDLIEGRKLQYSQDDMYSIDTWQQFNDDINRLIALIEPLHQQLINAKDAKTFATQIYQFLLNIELPVYLMVQKEIHKDAGNQYQALAFDQILNGINQVLDDFVEILYDKQFSYTTYAEILDIGFSSLEFSAVPQGLDQIQILNMDLAKVENKKVIFICGLNDEILPRHIKEDAIITDQEKNILQSVGNLQLAPTTEILTQDERFVAYIALTHAQEQLYLSYALMDSGYNAMRPSSFINDLKSIVKIDKEITTNLSPEDTITTVASGIHDVVQHYNEADWYSVLKFYEHLDQYQSIFSLTQYRNQTTQLSQQQVDEMYGDSIKASVSRFESYNLCAFKHFADHGLRLRSRDSFKLQNYQLGNIYHEVLAYLGETFKDNIFTVSQDEIRQAIKQYLSKSLPTVQFEIMYSKHHYRFMIHQIETMLVNTFMAIKKQQLLSKFRMSKFETRFGRHGVLDSQIISLPTGKHIEISGQIDRIDIMNNNDADYVTVIDYKSGNTSLDLRKVYYGIQMQMMTYMDVILQNKRKLGLKSETKPAGMLYFQVYAPKLKLETKSMVNDDLNQIREAQYKMQGYVLEDINLATYFDESLIDMTQSNVIPVTLTKKGTFNAYSKVLSEPAIYAFIERNRKNFIDTAAKVLDGDCSIKPLQYNDKLPCEYCDFKAVCHIDPLMNATDVRRVDESINPIELVMEEDK